MPKMKLTMATMTPYIPVMGMLTLSAIITVWERESQFLCFKKLRVSV